MRYTQMVEDAKKVILDYEKNNKPKVYTKVPLNKDGVISGITIIEIVAILGILISYFAIAFIIK